MSALPTTHPFARFTGPQGAPTTLCRADALRSMPRDLAAGSADVVVTSPPYNLDAAYGEYDDARPSQEYLRWIGRVGRCVARVLAESGSFFVNLGGPPSDPGWPWEVARAAGRPFVLQNVIHWVKSIAIEKASTGRTSGLDRDIAVGHYKPVNSHRYLNSAHEYIFHFTHRGDVELERLAIGVPYQDRSNATRWGAGRSGLRCRGNTWFLPYPTIQHRSSDRPHPTAFPPELPERCLRLHGVGRIRLAVDPFVGIGGSAIAALRVGVPFVGYDIDATYLTETARLLERAGAVRTGETPDLAAPVDRGAPRARERMGNRGRRVEGRPTPGLAA
ncbi:MAG: site-specific DNA-methyltransferase [Thermoplasmata archaeon]|nr:site-specific DNA-methyltransferase [Thermoplasmata archaeon]MCI4359748.1 site-specific DNA-methyltransferase [Thermoplasmata archaeon]